MMQITKQKVMLKIIFMVGSSWLLTGCVGIGGNFDCNVSSGGKCAPMHQINTMADRGEFQDQSISNASLYIDNKRYRYSPANFADIPMRSSDKVQQIWLGPYEDKQGNYHEPSYVYAVVKKGEWEPMAIHQDK